MPDSTQEAVSFQLKTALSLTFSVLSVLIMSETLRIISSFAAKSLKPSSGSGFAISSV
jgi:hypothetical protein